MFKCCVCNKSPRKGKSDSELSKTRQDGKKAVSPVLTNSSARIEETRTPKTEDKLNGDVQRKVSASKENHVAPTSVSEDANVSQNCDGDVWQLRTASSPEKRDTKFVAREAERVETVEEGRVESTAEGARVERGVVENGSEGQKGDEVEVAGNEAEEVKSEGGCKEENAVGSKGKEEGEVLGSKGKEEEEVVGSEGKEEDELVGTKGKEEDEVVGSKGKEEDEGCRRSEHDEVDAARGVNGDDLSEEDQLNIMNVAASSVIVRTNLYDAAAYIERTIDDGPDDEGDDSVFEACPSENENSKKETPGCETSDREEHLEELVSRLENVTRRLEKVPAQTQETAVQTNTPSPKRPTSRTEQQKRVTSPAKMSQPKSVSVCNYENILAGSVQEYLQLSEKIGGDVAAHSKLVEAVFKSQLEYIQAAERIAAPAKNSTDMSLLIPMSKKMEEIQTFREKRRGSPYFNHLSAISESIPALGWVAVSDTPAPYVKEMNDAGQFYTNRVLKEWKEKDKIHAEWCKAWVQTLSDLEKYIRQYHTTGLVWGKGLSGAPASVPPPPVGMPPPPPPSMPTGDVAALNLNSDRSALFAQINQGENIMKNLKKTGSERQAAGVPDSKNKSAPCKRIDQMRTVPPASAPIDKPPVFEAVGKKWLVEYQNNADLKIPNVEMNNSVYMFRCQNSTLNVPGKVNTIVMDSCYRTNLIFDAVVSSVEFVNCVNVKMQVFCQVPTISIDKTDGVEIMLTGGVADVEVISSKSSGMNIYVQKENGEYTQHTVPEQYKTTVNQKGGLTTVPFDTFG